MGASKGDEGRGRRKCVLEGGMTVIGQGIIAGSILANCCNLLNHHKQATDSHPNLYIFFKEEESCQIQVCDEDDNILYYNSWVHG